MVVFWVDIDLTEEIDDALLSAPLDVFIQGFGDCGLLRPMTPNLPGLFEKPVIYRQVCRHV
jgi:hypothetical protein